MKPFHLISYLLVCAFIGFFCGSSCLAQSLDRKVFSSQGGKTTSAPYYFSFTIGEAIIGTDENNFPILTKGFEQPIDPSILDASYQQQLLEEHQADIRLYPNPAREAVFIQYPTQKDGNKYLYLYDAQGKIIQQLQFQKSSLDQGAKVDLTGVAEGAYWILISDFGKTRVFPLQVRK